MKAAFTLLELIFVVAILALLVAIAIPATSRATLYAARTKSISNLRQLGMAAHLYANDHDQKLPGQTPTAAVLPGFDAGSIQDRWPKLFCVYLTPSDPRLFLDPSDSNAAKLSPADILSNDVNNTGYVYNGFDELAQGGQPPVEVQLTTIETPTNVVLISQKVPGAKDFYVNLLTSPLASLFSVLNPASYDGGSNYLYVDGSVRYLKQNEYSNSLWLVNKNSVLPPLLNSMSVRYARQDPPTE